MKHLAIALIMLIITACSQNANYQISEHNGVTTIVNNNKAVKDLPVVKVKKLLELGSNLENPQATISFAGDRLEISVDFDNSGNIFVTNSKNFNIQQFSKNGEFIKTLGGKGRGPGEFSSTIASISIYKDTLYALENSGEISLFTVDGLFIKKSRLDGMMFAKNLEVNQFGTFLTAEVYSGEFNSTNFYRGSALLNLNRNFECQDTVHAFYEKFSLDNVSPESFEIYHSYNQQGNFLYSINSQSEYKLVELNKNHQKQKIIKKKYHQQKRSDTFMQKTKKSLEVARQKLNNSIKFQNANINKMAINQVFYDNENNIWCSVEESIYDDSQKLDYFDSKGIFIGSYQFPELKNLKILLKKGHFVGVTFNNLSYSKTNDGAKLVLFELVTENQ